MKLNPSRNNILSLIYIRTILELEITYSENGFITDSGRLTTTMMVVYNRIVSLEKTLYRAFKTLYTECLAIARDVWTNTKTDKDNFAIEIEPVICGIYFDNEKELKKLGLQSKQFSDIYAHYSLTTQCDFEVVSRKLVDEIFDNTQKAIFDYKKQLKRG